MKHKNIIIVAIAFLFSIQANAIGVKKLSHKDSVNALTKVLQQSNVLSSSHVGFAGTPSDTWTAFVYLVKIATKEELLVLTNDKNAVVRLYAYTGLQHKQYDKMKDITGRFSKDTNKVRSLSGCLMSEGTVAESIQDTGVWYYKEGLDNMFKKIDSDKKYARTLYNNLVKKM